MTYEEFLEKKALKVKSHGFEVEKINEKLFDFQQHIVKTALKVGKYAIFADTGLGKTSMQVEWAYRINEKTKGSVLILAPLGVTFQTIEDAKDILGYDIKYIEKNEDIINGINITNYEKLHKIDTSKFSGVVLDESGILKNYTGKTKEMLINSFKETQYKLCCTATPSPNDDMELLNHCEFLGIMKSSEALSIFFINDTQNMGNYKLKGHSVNDYWSWVCSWAYFISNPRDYGFKIISEYNLPKLNEIEITVKNETVSEGKLFYSPEKINATSLHKEKRNSLQVKLPEIEKIVNENSGKSILIWVYNNDESEEIKRLIPDSVEIKGSDSEDKKTKAAYDFAHGNIKILISKPSIFGMGLNFQICHTVIFVGVDFSYEMYYQALRRTWRFGQKKEVNSYIILSENEKFIMETVKRKRKNHEEMKRQMKDKIINIQNFEAKYKLDYTKKVVQTKNTTLINGDCIEEIKNIHDNSIDLMIFSPPFSNLYIYSDNYRDMGNTKNDAEFFLNFDFLIPELKRILKEGRICAVHVKNLAKYKTSSGVSGIKDFRGECIRSFEKHGLVYHSEVCIWTDPVLEMQKTKTQRLLYKQLRNDASKTGIGMPEYILLFRKWDNGGDTEVPIKHFKNELEMIERLKDKYPDIYEQMQNLSKEYDNVSDIEEYKTMSDFEKVEFIAQQDIPELKNIFDLDKWQKYASPVWFDIKRTDVLNVQLARENEDEKHICPLQLGVIERVVELWSNPGEVVFTPFMGIGSEVFQSLKLGRKGIGIELKESYFNQAVKNIQQIENDSNKLKLF